ncbi:g2512 [Coccomyxa elongata]
MSLSKMLETLDADIICIQETKLSRKDMDDLQNFALADGWSSFFAFCTHRSGYSGVATFCRASTAQPLAAEEGLAGTVGPQNDLMAREGVTRMHSDPSDKFWDRYRREDLEMIDNQGRCVITDHGAFVLFNCYGPAVTNITNDRFAFKMQFYEVLQHRIEGVLHAGRPSVVAGDLNIAPYPIDHCDFVKAPAYIQAGMLTNRPDRAWFRRMLQEEGGPLVDLFRKRHPNEQKAYTVWDKATLARKRNHGSRVDFLLAASPEHLTKSARRSPEPCKEEGAQQPFNEIFTDVRIWSGFEGSDHAPVWADLELPEPLPMGKHPPALSLTNRRTGAGPQQGKITSWLQGAPPAKRRKVDSQNDTPPRESLDDIFS